LGLPKQLILLRDGLQVEFGGNDLSHALSPFHARKLFPTNLPN
jgi:hypothetical protein